jgi:hypothetical protein
MMVVSVVNHRFRHRRKNLLQSVSSSPSFGMIRDVDSVQMLRKVTDADDGGSEVKSPKARAQFTKCVSGSDRGCFAPSQKARETLARQATGSSVAQKSRSLTLTKVRAREGHRLVKFLEFFEVEVQHITNQEG